MTYHPAGPLLLSLALLVPFGPTTPEVLAQDATPGRAEFRLAPDADGQCNVVEKTDVVTVSRSKQPFVTFAVTSACEGDVVFTVSGFRHPNASQGDDPIVEAGGQRRLRVRAGRGEATMRLRVKADAVEGEWSYDVRLDDRLVDPKLQIDP